MRSPEAQQGRDRPLLVSSLRLAFQALICWQFVFDQRAACDEGPMQPHGDEGRVTGAESEPTPWPFQLHLHLPKSAPLPTPSISLDAENLMP